MSRAFCERNQTVIAGNAFKISGGNGSNWNGGNGSGPGPLRLTIPRMASALISSGVGTYAFNRSKPIRMQAQSATDGCGTRSTGRQRAYRESMCNPATSFTSLSWLATMNHG